MKKANKGFTLIEMVVVVTIIAIIAGIITPYVFRQIESASKTKALAETKNIATAIAMYKKDTGFWPTGAQGANTVEWLYGNGGTTPTSNDFNDGNAEPLYYYLRDNTGNRGGSNWDGPYMQAMPADPWGKRYIVSSDGFWGRGSASNPDNVWVLSAGPNGVVETPDQGETLGGDDIGVLVLGN